MPPLNFSCQPETSIILPTYNRAGHLARAIESVLAQNYTDWELLVVDDGSQDGTFALVDRYLQTHSQIRYLKHQNRRTGYSRNAGIQASFGRYLGFIDSDDFYKPHHLKERVEFMKTHPEVDLIQGGVDIGPRPFFVVDFFDPSQMISVQDCVLGATFFGKRSVFFELGGFNDLAYGEDTEFWARAEARFVTQTLLNSPTYCYERLADSISVRIEESLKGSKSS